MRSNLILIRTAAVAVLLAPLAATAAMTPGLYDYTVKMSVPGAPANMPAQTFQRCLMEGSKAYEMPPNPGSDCQIKDLSQSGGQFSYKMACTKPQKIDGAVQGSLTSTGMTMEMTMTMAGMAGHMTQSITAKRVSDCK